MSTPTEPTAPAQDTGTEPTTQPTPTTPAAHPAPAPADETDWKAEARKWEQRAKENKNAAKELEELRAASMSDQEKAVKEAAANGRKAAAADYGRRLAAAELRAAASAAGVALDDIAEYIDVSRFVDADGEVDTKAIKTAVGRFAKLAPAASAGRSGGDHTGASGDAPASLDKQINDAQAAGNWTEVIRLKRQRAATQQT
jgi:hypothetical protein